MNVRGGASVVRGRRVCVDGRLRPAAVHVAGGIIAAVTDWDQVHGAAVVVDVGDLLLTPGLADAHVHVNEPGRTEWEGFATATAAAAAGGVTTIVDMPLNSVPATTNAAGVAAKRAALDGVARVDVALWGGLVPGNAAELPALAAAGVAGVKCFLSPSGVDEFPHVGEAELDEAMPRLRELGLPLLAHAESPAVLARAAAAVAHGDPRAHATWIASRPPEAEAEAVAMLVRLCRAHGTRVHVVHVACREAAAVIASARAEGLPVSAETCPHYLTFDGDAVPAGATAYKCAPPLRSAAQREALWNALADGTLQLVATDHSPCPPSLKRLAEGDFFTAWGGIASLELLLPALWTGASARGHDVAAVVRWAATAPAELAGLAARKGRIAVGLDADLVAWDDTAEFVVDAASLHHRHALTPWAGRRLRGVVRQTWIRGVLAYDRGRGWTERPTGTFLAVPPRGASPAAHS